MASKEKTSSTPDLSQLTMLANALPPDFRESVLEIGKSVLEIRKVVRARVTEASAGRNADQLLQAAERLADELDKVLPDKAVKALTKSKSKPKVSPPPVSP